MAADAFIQLFPSGAANWPYDNTQRPGDVTTSALVKTSPTGAPFSYVNAPDGTTVTFTILSGPGTLSAASAVTVGGFASVRLTNTGTGTTVLRASVNITVSGTPLTRTTGDGLSTDSLDFTATWVYAHARITFTGVSAHTQVGPVNTVFTITAHVEVDSGSGFVNAPNGTVINYAITGGPGAFVGGISSCTTSGGTGACSVAVVSATPGTGQFNAFTAVTVNGVTLTPATNDQAQGDSADTHAIWGQPPILHVRWSTGGYGS